MTDDRTQVFANIRSALDQRPTKASQPEWAASVVVCTPPQAFTSLTDHFRFKFEAAGGFVIEGWAALIEFLKQQALQRGYADPAFAVPLQDSQLTIEHSFDRARVDEYEFGITAAFAAIAESGSLVLSEQTTSSRLGALAPWVHIAVVQHSRVLSDIPSAIAEFGDDRALAFVTGPSKTADVEGILIKGVHGPGIQVCCLV